MTDHDPPGQIGKLSFLGNNTVAIAFDNGMVEQRFGRGFMFSSVCRFDAANARKVANWMLKAADIVDPPKAQEEESSGTSPVNGQSDHHR